MLHTFEKWDFLLLEEQVLNLINPMSLTSGYGELKNEYMTGREVKYTGVL